MSRTDPPPSSPCDPNDEDRATPADRERPGLPDPETVVAEETFTSPKGRRYRILKTRQTDAYDEPRSDSDEPD